MSTQTEIFHYMASKLRMSITLSFNWELRTINIEQLYQILWKSDRPVSITLEFLKNLGFYKVSTIQYEIYY